MDISASVLIGNGFLKVGESYLLNHLGLEDAEGGNGIGCIQIKPGNQLNHFPKSHPICSMARVAVCGFWGQQTLPSIPSGMKMTKSAPTGAAKTTTQKTVPTAISLDIATQTDLSVSTDKQTPENSANLPRFSYNGKTFFLVTKSQGTLSAAENTCKQNQGTVATITTDSFKGISDSLKKMGHSRLIIGSWNGDTYSLTGPSCLILHTDYGIYPGSCAEGISVLCQAK
ncbi:hypothetical protein BD770DRAFT_401740 [Pilaira anomala]|nr:hypothetical protein BD770DRAFT_401740 [Pilaira anomala]